MVGIEFDFPTAEVEQQILTEEASVSPDTAQALVQLAGAIRRLETSGLREVASTRVLIAAARLTSHGLTLRTAARAADTYLP